LFSPRPRRFACDELPVVRPIPWLIPKSAWLDGMTESTCSAVVMPWRARSSLRMIVTGSAVSPSTRRMFVPVTSTRMSCALAGATTPAVPPAPINRASADATFLRWNSIGNPQ
jgi:hypothetical protein